MIDLVKAALAAPLLLIQPTTVPPLAPPRSVAPVESTGAQIRTLYLQYCVRQYPRKELGIARLEQQWIDSEAKKLADRFHKERCANILPIM